MVAEPTWPLAINAEITHRCPLHCAYCSNPLELARAREELDTAGWVELLRQGAELGVLQVGFTGGEPCLRPDLVELVAAARAVGLYTNLITSGVGLSPAKLGALVAAGLQHVQLSVQDSDEAEANASAGLDCHATKREVARQVVRAGLPLTLNAVLHRGNLDRLPAIIELAEGWGAQRLELAHVQYHGFAAANRAHLLPTPEQLASSNRTAAEARQRLQGRLRIDYVASDHFADRPKACMGGWGRKFLHVMPTGKVLPCHAAGDLPGMTWFTLRERSLRDIWLSPSFERYRGTAWMPEPCKSCPEREVDFGGCRCQAFGLLGDAAVTDPVCGLSPQHSRLLQGEELSRAEAPVLRSNPRS